MTYERNKEMAGAALAYKCMGVAHMRVVLSKNLCLTGDWQELHAAFQNATLGNFTNLVLFYPKPCFCKNTLYKSRVV